MAIQDTVAMDTVAMDMVVTDMEDTIPGAV